MNKFMIGLIVGLCLTFVLEPKQEYQDSFDIGDNVLVNMDDAGVQKGIIVSEINTQAKVRVDNNEYVVPKESLVEY